MNQKITVAQLREIIAELDGNMVVFVPRPDWAGMIVAADKASVITEAGRFEEDKEEEYPLFLIS